MEPYLAIINPQAGNGRCGKQAPRAIGRLRAAGLNLETVETNAPGHATVLAREAYARGRRRFISVGGDGNTFEVINGLFPEAARDGERVSLGFLPLGTGNSFLRDFSTGGVDYAERAIREDKHRTCDLVRLRHADGELYYINLLSLGFVADVCTLANRRFKRLGFKGYGLSTVLTTAGLRAQPFPLRADTGLAYDKPVNFLSICNSRFTGGNMMMAPDADTADGKVDVIIVPEVGRATVLRFFPALFKGTHVNDPRVVKGKVRSVEFSIPAPVDVMIDGEVLHIRPQQLEVLPAALEVMA